MKVGLLVNAEKLMFVRFSQKGDTEDPNNYRPISITPVISKSFEKIIREQIMEYLNKNKLLSQVQFGFRKRFSATDALDYATEKNRKRH